MPVWSLTMVATKVTSQLPPVKDKASIEYWGPEFFKYQTIPVMISFSQRDIFLVLNTTAPSPPQICVLSYNPGSIKHLDSCSLVPRCPKFSCGGLSSLLLFLSSSSSSSFSSSSPFFSSFPSLPHFLLFFLPLSPLPPFSLSSMITYSQQHAHTFPAHHMAHISRNTEKVMRRWVIFTVWQSWQLPIKWNEPDFNENSKCQPRKSTAIVVCGGAAIFFFFPLLIWFGYVFFCF